MNPLLVWRSPDGYYTLVGYDGDTWTPHNADWGFVERFAFAYGYTIISPNSVVAAVIRDNMRKRYGPICPE